MICRAAKGKGINCQFLNTIIPVYFENARAPVVKLFTPDLDVKKWRLAVVKIEVEYRKEGYWTPEVVIETSVSDIGRTSFTVIQRALQRGTEIAFGKSVLVHVDFSSKKALPITRGRTRARIFNVPTFRGLIEL